MPTLRTRVPGDALCATLNAVAMAEDPFAYPGGWLPIRYEQRCRERRALLDQALSVAVARERSDIVRLIVFGSYARGSISAWSDLDLLVVSDDDSVAAVDAINDQRGGSIR